MIDKTQLVKNNKNVFYITYTILLTFVIFNYEKVFSVLGYAFSLATPLYIAIIIAFILNIPMKKIEIFYGKLTNKFALKRGLALATTLLLTTFLLLLVSSFIIPKIGESISLIVTNIFNYSNRLVSLVNDTLENANVNYAINYDSIQEAITNLDLNNMLSINGNILSNAGVNLIFQSIGIFGTFVNVLTSFIMSLYLLANKETHIRQVKKVITFFFGYKRSLTICDIGMEANHYFNSFVSGQLLESCILTSLMYAGFKLTGMPFPELLACIIGIASLVPMFGGFFGFGISFILVLAINPTQAIVFALCFILIQQFESNLIYPRVVGNAVGISGVYVLLSLVIFGNLFGFFGLLIAVPSMALIYAVGSRMVNISLYRKNIEVTSTTIKKFTSDNNSSQS